MQDPIQADEFHKGPSRLGDFFLQSHWMSLTPPMKSAARIDRDV
jgi:hypothetical protein